MIPAVNQPGPPGLGTEHRILRGALLLGLILSLAVAYGVAQHGLIVGSVDGHWVYPYVRRLDLWPVEIALLVSLVAGALLWLPDAVVRRREWVLVAVWVVAATALQGLLRSLTPFTFERIFTSNDASSYYGVTLHYDASSVLSDFVHLRAYWPAHAQSNMPGKLILIYALEYVSMSPTVLAWLVVAVSNLGGVLLYVFVRDLFADRLMALFSLVLYLFVPAKLVFFPLMSTVTPVFVLGCAYLLLRTLQTSRGTYAVFLGAGLYGLAFFDPLGLAIGLLLAGLIVRALWLAEVSWRTLLRQSGLAVLAFGATYVVMRVWFGFDLFGALRVVITDAIGFDQQYRPYSIWVRQDLLDFFFGVGVCQAVVCWVVLGKSLTGSGSWRSRLARPIAIVGLGLVGALLAVDLTGVNRGEVIRLWIFLACLFQIPTVYACARLQSRTALALVLAATLVQDAIATSTIGFIIP